MSEASAALKELLFPDMEEAQWTNAFESTVPVFPPDGVVAKETWDETIEMIRGADSETDFDTIAVDVVVQDRKCVVSGKRVTVRVDSGGSRLITHKTQEY